MTLPATVAVDVGGTKIRAGSVIDGELAHVRSVPTPAADGAQAVLNTIAEVAAAVIAETSGSRGAGSGGRGSAGSGGLAGGGDGSGSEFAWRIGIGAAGVIDPVTGTVVSATESLPGWAGTDLVAELTARTGLPVRVVNDVHAHALGEAVAGASRDSRSSLLVAAGTGIGGGFITDGHLLTGRNSAAGHIGHVPSAAAAGLACPCGGTGHVEAIASGPAILNTYRRLACGSAESNTEPAEPAAQGQSHNSASATAFRAPTSTPNSRSDRAGAAPAPTNTRELAVAASAGDALALRAFDIGARALGSALGGIVNVLSPEVVVIGGGLADMDETWWGPLCEAFAAELIPAASGTPLVKAELGQDAALIGAAGLWNDAPGQKH
ncbi:ROK family protein [Brevibacterium sediminis]|uniref:ROK family protein n=1 Tax=Brevibacterium sediminis TaxID=1857024 RepID=UPI00217538CA|nr:ROK family protein [Brevibacterium sediminis]